MSERDSVYWGFGGLLCDGKEEHKDFSLKRLDFVPYRWKKFEDDDCVEDPGGLCASDGDRKMRRVLRGVTFKIECRVSASSRGLRFPLKEDKEE